MTTSKKLFIAFLGIFILIQFIRPARNIDSSAQPNDIFVKYPATDSVKGLVKVACYDCHSNNTQYPWYANIQPIGLWLQHHVDEGKQKLNFSEFLAYPAKKGAKKMDETIDLVKKKAMPLSSYTLIHKDAILTDMQREQINAWADSVENQLDKQAVN